MSTIFRLKVVSFLQYFIWGSWLVTLASYLFNTLQFKGSDIGLVFSSLGLASLFAPVVIGMVADKINNRKLVFITLHLLSAVTLILVAYSTSVTMLFLVLLLNLMFYMPSISMCNSILFELLEQQKLESNKYFPKIRVFGTVGFIAAMWTISLLKLETSHYQLFIASGASVVLAIFSLTLPAAKAIDKSEKEAVTTSNFNMKNILFVFQKHNVVVFLFFAMLLGSVLQITNTLGVPFLQDLAKNPEAEGSLFASFPTIFLSISQFSEVCFILVLPFLLKKIKIETILLFSMLAWILRFGLFAYGDFSTIGTFVLLLSMIVYGCAFDFFNISGSLFLDKEIPLQYRSTAQGIFTTFVNGFGTYLGAMLSGWVLDLNTVNGVVDWHMFWIVFACYTGSFTILYSIYMLLRKPSDSQGETVNH
ncbi:MFS transporter [Providencia sp. Je.9.19]|uniref:MFS transporter n=1 Tax=unclassified Providencia TaxID=2633465 RepID=UPI003DA9EDAA